MAKLRNKPRKAKINPKKVYCGVCREPRHFAEKENGEIVCVKCLATLNKDI